MGSRGRGGTPSLCLARGGAVRPNAVPPQDRPAAGWAAGSKYAQCKVEGRTSQGRTRPAMKGSRYSREGGQGVVPRRA
eukprot:scaffold240451_cov27-Tisochrysis_lutea.AAC.2